MPTEFVNQRFGMLLVLDKSGVDHRQQTLYKCVCDCGVEKIVRSYSLKSGNTKSCGCMRKINGRKTGLTQKHGLARTTTYRSWETMKDRCSNVKSPSYKYYGALGVTFCDNWMEFEGFLKDMGIRPDGTTLDRINPFGDYEPSNCRWATSKEQGANKRKSYMKGMVCQQHTQ